MSLNADALYFLQEYRCSLQAKVQCFITQDKALMFRKAVYCLLTPATKAEAANQTLQELFTNDWFFHASQQDIALCLRKSPYVRFHNQKAQRLIQWRAQGDHHLNSLLKHESEKEMRRYLVKNVSGFNYKEASHFLRNIGRGNRLAILDRHIITFLKEERKIPQDAKISASVYEDWEDIFCVWADEIGVPVPQADFALWAAGVKKHSRLSYEQILQDLE